MKKNLNEQLGSKYVQEMYAGSMFRAGDDVVYIRAVGAKSLVVDSIPLEGDVMQWERKEVSADLLQDFSSFQYPALGYRQGPAGKYGNVVTYLTSKRSALRGLRMDQLLHHSPAIYSILYPDDLWQLVPKVTRVRAVFNPQYTPFTTGLASLMKGDIAGFAVNNNVACAMSCSGNGDRLGDILFRGKVVGHIDAKAEVTIVNKIMHRDSMKSLFSS